MKCLFQNSFLMLMGLLFTGCVTHESPSIDKEVSAVENGLTKSIVVKGDAPQLFSIEERMKHHKVPGVSIAVVREGKIRWAKGYGKANTTHGTPVNTSTLFQAGSISKPVAALSVLKLFEEGVLDLDSDVNSYLKDWKIEENKYTKEEKVTLRRLLTHTAGMTVHGFPGYQQKDTFPSIEQVLNGKGNTPKIELDTIPGSLWRYSGGGYTVMEKVVEDVSTLSLEEYMAQNILTPLGMKNSTYTQPLPEKYHANASAAYDAQGTIIEGLWHNYPEQAAAGLWTTPTDLATYCIAIQNILAGKSSGILNKETIEMMLTKHKNDWGLGPSLTWEADSLRFQHGGKNAGFTNNMIAFAHRGDAIIVMTNADNGGKLIGEIMRSVSSYYHLGIASSKEVETTDLTNDQLEKLTGRYKYVEQVPEIGDYFVDIVIQNNMLVVLDPNNKERDEMAPLSEISFIDMEDGDRMEFKTDTLGIGFLWNNRFQFHKVVEDDPLEK